MNSKINYGVLRLRSDYIIDEFKKGNFNVEKLKDEAIKNVKLQDNTPKYGGIAVKTILNTEATFTGLPEEY